VAETGKSAFRRSLGGTGKKGSTAAGKLLHEEGTAACRNPSGVRRLPGREGAELNINTGPLSDVKGSVNVFTLTKSDERGSQKNGGRHRHVMREGVWGQKGAHLPYLGSYCQGL